MLLPESFSLSQCQQLNEPEAKAGQVVESSPEPDRW
jgi:hypothetical protein